MGNFNLKLSFGVQSVAAGQKSSSLNALPQLTANSTLGKFSITAVVSKAMGVAVGENIMFLNNISNIEAAIQAKDPAIVEYAKENNIDLDSAEGVQEVVSALTQWFIAKGVAQFDSKGQAVMTTVRMTVDEKKAIFEKEKMNIVASNRDALVAKFGDLTDEELADKLSYEIIEAPEVQACFGSKTATTGSAQGVGLPLGFTDTAIWGALKSDIKEEERTKVNRVFDVKLDDATTIEFNNGYENVSLMIYPIEFAEDKDPIRRDVKTAE